MSALAFDVVAVSIDTSTFPLPAIVSLPLLRSVSHLQMLLVQAMMLIDWFTNTRKQGKFRKPSPLESTTAVTAPALASNFHPYAYTPSQITCQSLYRAHVPSYLSRGADNVTAAGCAMLHANISTEVTGNLIDMCLIRMQAQKVPYV